MRHVRRYRCVRDLRQKGHTKDRALDLAVAALEATGETAAGRTIEDSYDLVSRDLKRAGRERIFLSRYPKRPDAGARLGNTGSDGVVTINGVAQRSRGRDR